MTSSPGAATVDTELLELAEVVLHQSGYTVAPLSTDGVSYLLAEDQDNVIVLTTVVSVDDVFAVEPALSRALSGRLASAPAESKKWDGYVIVITSTRPDDSMTEALFSLTYDLNQARRLVRVGVEATTAAVARSLRAVLPLSEPTSEAGLLDPLTALERRLVADGLSTEEVAGAIAAFRAEAAADLSNDVGGVGTVRDTSSDPALETDIAANEANDDV